MKVIDTPTRVNAASLAPDKNRAEVVIGRARTSRNCTATRFSLGSLRLRFAQVKSVWTTYRSSRKRDAVYDYLQAVFALVAMWAECGNRRVALQKALETATGKSGLPTEPFEAAIVCTSDPNRVDRRTVSKWSRALQYAAICMIEADTLRSFMRKAGGVNDCACRLTRKDKPGIRSGTKTARRNGAPR